MDSEVAKTSISPLWFPSIYFLLFRLEDAIAKREHCVAAMDKSCDSSPYSYKFSERRGTFDTCPTGPPTPILQPQILTIEGPRFVYIVLQVAAREPQIIHRGPVQSVDGTGFISLTSTLISQYEILWVVRLDHTRSLLKVS
jgi:hypothetical protein